MKPFIQAESPIVSITVSGQRTENLDFWDETGLFWDATGLFWDEMTGYGLPSITTENVRIVIGVDT